MTTQPEMPAAQAAVNAATADFEAKRAAAVAAAADVAAAERAQRGAIQDAQAVHSALQALLNQAVVITAPARIQTAAQDQSTAIAAFRANVQTDPVFGALVAWLTARWRAKHWDSAQAGAQAALDPASARQATSQFTVPQISGTEVADLLADAINAASRAAMDKIAAGVAAQQSAFIEGTSSVASPPTDAASLA